MILLLVIDVEVSLDEVIDLRPYVEGLLRYWWIIAGTTLLVAALFLVVTRLLPVIYQATALVAIIEPSQRLQFDPRFETIVEELPLTAVYPELAVSDALLSEVLRNLPAQVEGHVQTLAELRDMVVAEPSDEPGLLRLQVRYTDPEITAAVANSWGATFVEWVNELYGYGSPKEAEFFAHRLAEARAYLGETEDILIDFQARNRLTVIDNQLNALSELQSAYLLQQQNLTFTLADAEALREQLAGGNNAPVTVADQVTALALQAKAYNAHTTIPVPLQLQFTADTPITSANRSEQLSLLDNLTTTLNQSLALIDERLRELDPQFMQLQEQRQEALTELNQLQRERDLAQESYLALARKVEEERLIAADTSSGVSLASTAAVPLNPVSPSLLLNIAAGIIIGLLGGILLVFLRIWRSVQSPVLRPARTG
jgi:uncharacterized protein involved in exopolysaccharide biosynthesis